jgi:uncharacterized membrane protein
MLMTTKSTRASAQAAQTTRRLANRRPHFAPTGFALSQAAGAGGAAWAPWPPSLKTAQQESAMVHSISLASLSPAVVVHLVLATSALVLGPLALRSRKGSRFHRSMGYAFVTLIVGAALSSIFIRDFRLPNLWGYTPIHILTVVTLVGVGGALLAIARRDIARHKRAMWSTYLGGCIGAGVFALLPGRYLGDLLWHHGLGLV